MITRRSSCERDERLSATSAGAFILECMRDQGRTSIPRRITWIWPAAVLAVMIILAVLLAGCEPVWAESFVTKTSYYTRASCLHEGTTGITASGEMLKDEGEYTCAHPTLSFGTRLRIKFQGREIVARVNDRGPNKKLVAQGRTLDLNLSAAKALKMVQMGVAIVTVEVI